MAATTESAATTRREEQLDQEQVDRANATERASGHRGGPVAAAE